jgi:hypothetical protein
MSNEAPTEMSAAGCVVAIVIAFVVIIAVAIVFGAGATALGGVK